jgi:hypothetical protein
LQLTPHGGTESFDAPVQKVAPGRNRNSRGRWRHVHIYLPRLDHHSHPAFDPGHKPRFGMWLSTQPVQRELIGRKGSPRARNHQRDCLALLWALTPRLLSAVLTGCYQKDDHEGLPSEGRENGPPPGPKDNPISVRGERK